MSLTAQPGSAHGCTGRCRRLVVTAIVIGVVVSGCANTGAVEETADLFEHYEMVTGTDRHQTIAPGFFRGGNTAEIFSVYIDAHYDRRAQMYGLENGDWVPVLDARLRRGVVFIDVANIAGRDTLITYEPGRVNWFDIDSSTEHTLLDVTTNYRATDPRVIPRIDITRDINHDGRDDLLVPDVDGFWVSVQLDDGSFTHVVKLGPPEPFLNEYGLDDTGLIKSKSYRDVGITSFTAPFYLGRVHEMDYNQDGRSDLVFWNKDHFEVHLQNTHGRFSAHAKSFRVDVPIDADGVYSHIFEFGDTGVFRLVLGLKKKVERTMVQALRDMNGDDVTDLVTLTLTGRGPFKQRSVYRVHFGAPTSNSVVFSPKVSTTIHPQGKAGAGQPWGYASRWFEDFNGDGQVDILLTDVRMGLGGMVGALAARSVAVDLEAFRMDHGVYSDTPGFKRHLKWSIDSFGGAVLLGDVNGDGRADLLMGGKRSTELIIFFGIPGPDIFAPEPRTAMNETPFNGERTWLANLNDDGKQDILMYHASKTAPQRLTILIAQ